MSDTLFQVLLASGGAAVVVGLIFAGLWRFGSNALLTRFEHSQAVALERLRSELAQSSGRLARYEGAQFGKYQEIWDMLVDLDLAAERLWDRATDRNVCEFGERVQEVCQLIYGACVLIEDPHLSTLQGIIDEFREFYDGKQGLLDLRRQAVPDERRIAQLIARNGRVRESFHQAIAAFSPTLREQLVRGPGTTAGA